MSSHPLPPAPSLPGAPSLGGSVSLPPSSSLHSSISSSGAMGPAGMGLSAAATGGGPGAGGGGGGPHAPSSSTSGSSSTPPSSSSSSPSNLRSSLLCLARTAERSERWDDVCRFMKELIKLLPIQMQQQGGGGVHNNQVEALELTDEERHLLVLGYKQTLGAQRNAWKVMRQIQQATLAQQQQQQQQQVAAAAAAAAAQAQSTSSSTGLPPSSSSLSSSSSSSLSLSSSTDEQRFLELQEDYKQQIEKELHLQCSELIQLIETILIKHTHTPEHKVHHMKMCGDQYRYLAELVLARTGFTAAGLPGGYDKKSHEMYAMAYKLAATALPSNHPTRLSTALNLSVCLWEVARERKAACEVAKAAFDGAIAKLEELPEASYKDATLIMQLLRDNLTLWTNQSAPQQPQATPQQQH